MIGLSTSVIELSQLLEANQASIQALRAFPSLRATSGRHYADILLSLAEKRRQSFRGPGQTHAPDIEAAQPQPVQKETQAGPLVRAGGLSATAVPNEIPVRTEVTPGLDLSMVPVISDTEARAPTAPHRPTTPIEAVSTEPLSLPSNRSVALQPLVQRAPQLPNALSSHVSLGASDSQRPELTETVTTQALDPRSFQSEVASGGTATGSEAKVRLTSFPNPARTRPGWQIDKSILNYSSQRRIRNKEHLQYVASEPCLACEQAPCHAHHITFAQSRGLSLKVSDEFTVPLCALHHNAVHQHPSERAWWANLDIDPLQAAARLWQQTLQRLIERAEHKTVKSAL